MARLHFWLALVFVGVGLSLFASVRADEPATVEPIEASDSAAATISDADIAEDEEGSAKADDEDVKTKEEEKTSRKSKKTKQAELPARDVGLFQARDDGDLEVKFVAKSAKAGRVIITNHSKQPLSIKLPEAFVGMPALAQFGGGGGGGRGGGGGGGGGGQSVGGGGGGGGGGVFSIPPERTAKIDVALLCLEHGKPDPSSTMDYVMVPANEVLDKPEVIELVKAFGRGELDHGAAQAAAWNLNSDMSWEALASKEVKSQFYRNRPYFSREQIAAGMAYAQAAFHQAEINAAEYEKDDTEAEESVVEYEPAPGDEDYVAPADEEQVEEVEVVE
jgi:hypothetical protein